MPKRDSERLLRSRDRLAERLIAALSRDVAAHGPEILEALRRTSPQGYARLLSALVHVRDRSAPKRKSRPLRIKALLKAMAAEPLDPNNPMLPPKHRERWLAAERAASASTTLLGLPAEDWAAGIGGLRGRIVAKLVAFVTRGREWREVDACALLLTLSDADWRRMDEAADIGMCDACRAQFPALVRRWLTAHLAEIAREGARPSLRNRAARLLGAIETRPQIRYALPIGETSLSNPSR
jgi:hypothetical protein